jgi:diguanylate cyclase (GGDEF)-like protein
MTTKLLRLYFLGTLAAIGGFVLIQPTGWLEVFWQVAIGWVAAAAVVFGMRRHRPRCAVAWYLFAAGVFLNSTGILAQAVGDKILHLEGYPTIADPLWLALYPGLGIGLILLIRSRSSLSDWPAILDTTTITTGLGLLSWVFVIHPQASDPTLSLLGRAAVVSYPVGDVIVLAMMVRILVDGSKLAPSLRLLLASMLTFLVGDISWAVIFHFGLTPGPLALHLLEANFGIAYSLVGAAGLHRSVGSAADRVPAREAGLSAPLLAGLTIASLIAPVLLIAQAVDGVVSDPVAIGVSSAAMFALVVGRMAGLLRQIQVQSAQLRDLSRIDELTGLPNRRAWSLELPVALERARRDGRPLSVAMIDLDHFKRFNDTYGHPAGDALLRGAAHGWREKLRVVDVIARYGGEEFVVLLPDADGPEATTVLERLREATPSGQTFSAGVATWDELQTGSELIACADAALYVAKTGGRNCTVVADAPERSRAVNVH